LKSDEGKESFLQFVRQADVVIESFRLGVMKRHGLDYETLQKINPRLIYCANTGNGQTGPYANLPGNYLNFLIYAGFLDLLGESYGELIIPATTIADIGGGALPATICILLSLFNRQETGRGQLVDISMLDGVISWLQTVLPNYLLAGEVPQRGQQ